MKEFTINEYKIDHLLEDRLAYCYQEKWFKIFVPKSYGGLELSMKDACKKLNEISSIQGGLGWTINLGAGANWFSGFFEEQVAQKVFFDDKIVIAGSGYLGGNWKLTKDGFIVNGSWTKCTGAAHATYFSVISENELGEEKIFIVPRTEVQLDREDWQIAGMKNSSSFKIILENSFVPAGYDFKMNDVRNHHEYKAFHIPFDPFARLCITASYLGTIRCLVRLTKEAMDKEWVNNQLDIIETKLSIAEKELNGWAEKVEELSFSKKFNDVIEQKMNMDLGNRNVKLFHDVQTLFLIGGLPFVEEDKILHWAYRDVLVAAQHYLVKP